MNDWPLIANFPDHDHQRVLMFGDRAEYPTARNVLVTSRSGERPLLTYQWHGGPGSGWVTEDAAYPDEARYALDGDSVHVFDLVPSVLAVVLWLYSTPHGPQLISHAPDLARLHLQRFAALDDQDRWSR